MLNIIIGEGLYDKAFARDWTHGFEDLCDYVKAFSPERVAAITGIPAATITELARAIAAARGCSFLMYTGLEYSDSGVQAIRAVWTLQALAGHLDAPGGKLFRMPDRPRTGRILTEPPAGSRPPIGADEFPLYRQTRNEAHASCLPRAILEGDPYPLRALIVSGASIITAWPDPDHWRRALAALDLLVAVNRFPTADMAYADLILPAATMFETQSYMIHDGRIQLRQRVIEPRGEARGDYLIFAELARRLGYGHLWPQSEEAMVERALEGTGITLEELRANPEGVDFPLPKMRYRKYETGELRADGKPGFDTPTGKFEIASEWLRAEGYEPLPVYTRAARRAAGGRRRGEALSAGVQFRGAHAIRLPLAALQHPLAAGAAAPAAGHHPQRRRRRAGHRGRRRGGCGLAARAGALLGEGHRRHRAGAVEANMGGGGPLGPEAWQNANVNDLTDPDNYDPLSGFPVYKALLCDVVPAPPGRPQKE